MTMNPYRASISRNMSLAPKGDSDLTLIPVCKLFAMFANMRGEVGTKSWNRQVYTLASVLLLLIHNIVYLS